MDEPAPLISTPDAPVPPGAEAEWVRGAGGGRLRAALFTPEGRARGSIVLSGGRTEPIEKYYETIGDFMERGFVVLAHDWRGQGLSSRDLSDRLKGHTRGYKAYLGDFKALLAAFQTRMPKPWVAVGHSMGGCLTLLAMAQGETRFAAAILSAPMLGVKTGKVGPRAARTAARLQILLGRAAQYVRGQPRRSFEDEFEGNVLTHDEARFRRTRGLIAAEPQLALGAPTWGWLDFALGACAYLAKPERLNRITVPVVIVSADDDRLVDNAAQAAAARCLPQGKLIKASGAYHEILMETDPVRNIFMRAFDALVGRAAPKPAAAPRPTAEAAVAPPQPTASAPEPAAAVAAPKTAAATPAPAKPAVAKPAAAKAPAAKPAVAKASPAKASSAKAAPAKLADAKPKPRPAAKAAPKSPAEKPAAAAKVTKPAKSAAAVKKPASRTPAASKAS
jgi:alpha-beta hydrolase superfamily lysophospholipase